jgi:Zn-dependent protease/predicted transcriptional regulator
LDVSVLIIFSLVVYSLGEGLFPQWHPDWGMALRWGTALAAGLLFFSSLLAHELAHSVVAQSRGIPVPRITLFVFGGVSEMQHEPRTPADEFAIAIVGPATSLLLGAIFSILAVSLGGAGFAEALAASPESALAGLGPLATLMIWLGPVNLMLGVFNLIPGFPLDGGRVFRAALWWGSGDLRQATEWAANAGRGFAWVIMGLGVFEALGGFVFQGLWLILIGWFLNNAARASHAQLLLRQMLESLHVRDLMRTRFESVQAGLPLPRFIDDCLLRSGQSAWPVLDGDRPVGLVGFDDVRRSPEAGRERRSIRDIMVPIREPIAPDVVGPEALRIMLASERDPVPVMESGRMVGLLHRADIMRWLALHQLSEHNKV